MLLLVVVGRAGSRQGDVAAVFEKFLFLRLDVGCNLALLHPYPVVPAMRPFSPFSRL